LPLPPLPLPPLPASAFPPPTPELASTLDEPSGAAFAPPAPPWPSLVESPQARAKLIPTSAVRVFAFMRSRQATAMPDKYPSKSSMVCPETLAQYAIAGDPGAERAA
jgi:hypothetical protein